MKQMDHQLKQEDLIAMTYTGVTAWTQMLVHGRRSYLFCVFLDIRVIILDVLIAVRQGVQIRQKCVRESGHGHDQFKQTSSQVDRMTLPIQYN